ncbi:unnamed protein product [Rangifer tarandus platyrhynchus]|uniref:Uncharacterized protein n=1 Tax=Rangifer tarandus platyrhynchus TaxID=3082113 RepID=A0AC59Z6N3_RANTA
MHAASGSQGGLSGASVCPVIPCPEEWLIPQSDSEGRLSPPPHSLVSDHRPSPSCAPPHTHSVVCTCLASTPLVLRWQHPVPPPGDVSESLGARVVTRTMDVV